MTRLIRFVGRGSGDPTATLGDGRVVEREEAVEVDPGEARTLLRNPGAADDSAAEWVPAPREVAP